MQYNLKLNLIVRKKRVYQVSGGQKGKNKRLFYDIIDVIINKKKTMNFQC